MKYDTFLLKCSGSATGYFMPELQTGFSISAKEGVTIYSFLTGYCGISDEYISGKVKTIMIDGGPVDDIFNTKIHDKGVCALSGAMPGIVGAMMRIGSPYAAMRESITVKPEGGDESGREILVDVKLFNVILADKGADFLKRGILLREKRIFNLFIKHGNDIFSCCREVLFNGKPVDFKKQLTDGVSMDRLVMLKLEMEDER
ncbi:MAG: hypothetical protein CVV49_03805 [Spirochaetae bacterium HGW-Spirochaetae-5]|nr:MAG: hypothetical protein CVV49_03805 [Spirochaetae bacterium HGW-Spirochaetae-5]